MPTRAIRWSAGGSLAALGVCVASVTCVAAEPSRREGPRAEVQAVALSLEEFLRAVLSNHRDLEVPSRTSRPGTGAEPRGRGLLAVRASGPAAGATEAGLRELVNRVLFQAIRAYWNQVRDLEDVEIRERAVAAAEDVARRIRGDADREAAELLYATARTVLAEARIDLHRARQRAAAGEDALKLLMNDEMLSVVSETRLVLLTRVQEPPPMDDLDVEGGIDTAIRNDRVMWEDRRDKLARSRYETLAAELKTARRGALAARAMFLLARSRRTAAEKALDAADEMQRRRVPVTAGGLLARIRAEQSLCDAERQVLTACVDYEIALAAWDRATGDLADRWNIRIEAASAEGR